MFEPGTFQLIHVANRPPGKVLTFQGCISINVSSTLLALPVYLSFTLKPVSIVMIADYRRLPCPQLHYHSVCRGSIWSGNELKASQSKFMILHTISILMGIKAEKVNRMASKVITGQKRRLNQNERLISFLAILCYVPAVS